MSSPTSRVIVVGAGNAALVAALAAHEQGAEVLVLEAASKDERGGNSRFSGAIFRFAHDGFDSLVPLLTEEAKLEIDRADVPTYSPQEYYDDCMRMSDGRGDPTLTKLLIDRSYETVEWMRDQGVQWELTTKKFIDPKVIASGERFALTPGGVVRAVEEGVGLMEDLFAAVERAGIEVWYDSPAMELLTSGATVHGVRVRRAGEDVDVEGVVVLACGGFEANPEMRMRYLGPGWDLVKVRGTRFNMGTMLERALEAGAYPVGHWGGCHASPQDADCPDVGDLALTDKMSRYSYPYGLLINTDCERFIDEGEDQYLKTYAKTGAAILSQPRGWATQLFDQKTLHLLEPRYDTGTPVESDTIRGIAEQLGLDPDRFERTVEAFNAATQPGEFKPFQKDGLRTDPGLEPPKTNWALPIDEPPYVAYRVTCGITFTYGGVKINEDAAVFDITGQPMGGLYATGEIVGGIFYYNYAGGSGLMRGAVLGRIAGANAAKAVTS